MAPTRRTTRASPATTTTTTPVTNAQLKELIDQGVVNALAARDANRSWNGDDSYNSGTGSRRTKRTTREYTYTDFLNFQPMNFKDQEIRDRDLAVEVKGTDVKSYTQRFHELALLCGRMFPEEFDKIETYVSGLPDMIHGSVMTFKPKIM
nr:hypothetical protein [Tanacetum cinerariifolium]